MPIALNPYSSTHPAIDALFTREFAGRQLDTQTEEAERQRQVVRQQIMAQERVAQAQQRYAQQQAEYNNLFRTQQLTSQEKAEAARNKILQQQADTDKAYREGILKRPDARTQSELEEANTLADAIASQLNAAYDTRLATRKAEIEALRQRDLKSFTPFTLDSTINTKYEQMLKDAEGQEFQAVLEVGTKNNPGQFKVDPATKRFVPVRFGGAVVTPVTPAVVPNPAALGTDAIVVPAPASNNSPKLLGIPGPIGDALFNPMGATAPAPAVAPVAPASVPSVRRAYGSRVILLTPEDDAMLRKTLDATPAELQPKVFRDMIERFRIEGRVVAAGTTVGGVSVTTPIVPAPTGATPDYLDSVLGPRPSLFPR